MSSFLLIALMVTGAILVLNAALGWPRARNLRRRLLNDWGRPRTVHRDLEAIASYHEWRATPGEMVVDDRAWSDLTMDEIFARIDRTESAIGRQMLYHRLHDLAPADRGVFEGAAQHFATDQSGRLTAQLTLAIVADDDAYDAWRLTRDDGITIPARYAVFPFLAVLAFASIVATPFWHPAVAGLAIVALVSIWARAATDRKLGEIRPAFRQVGPLLAAAERLAALEGEGIRPWITELRSHSRSLARLRKIAKWVARDPSRQNDLVAALYEYVNLIFVIDANALYLGINALEARRGDLARVIELVGNIDAAISVASWRAGNPGWCVPAFTAPATPTRLSAIRHPLVDDCVPNSVELGPPHGLIVTGSNMSGKSTFLRTVGVSVLLAQTINTVLADAYLSPLLALRSCIGRSDDITTGTSYYLAEVRAVLDLVRAGESGQAHLFLFDELFRGTNTAERVAAGEAVLATLGSSGRHLVIAATHDGELVERLAATYAPVHFTEHIDASGLSFDFRLRQGPATSRNAIALLELEGAPPRLIAAARAALSG
jgi:hypothetical protein